MSCSFSEPLVTAGARARPLWHGPSADRRGFGPVPARSLPALRSSATRIGRADGHGKVDHGLDRICEAHPVSTLFSLCN
jgi:hypothetical protein